MLTPVRGFGRWRCVARVLQVLESFVRSAPGLPFLLRQHLKDLEEQILEKIAWASTQPGKHTEGEGGDMGTTCITYVCSPLRAESSMTRSIGRWWKRRLKSNGDLVN
jgi:hypothetical protein